MRCVIDILSMIDFNYKGAIQVDYNVQSLYLNLTGTGTTPAMNYSIVSDDELLVPNNNQLLHIYATYGTTFDVTITLSTYFGWSKVITAKNVPVLTDSIYDLYNRNTPACNYFTYDWFNVQSTSESFISNDAISNYTC